MHATPSHAADASAWDGDSRSAARLLAAGAQDGVFRAGVEVRLSPGWKTYWRYPGDSGVPPHFDLSKSVNVKSVTVLWPAPQRIDDPEGTIIGYKNNVVFPLKIEPQNAAKPVVLKLNLDYAICEKLCIPVQSKAEIAVDGKPTPNDALIAKAQASVPKRQPFAADAPLSVRAVKQDETQQPPRILVDVAAPAGSKIALFAEGPTPRWALPVPEPVTGAPAGQQRFSFALDGLPSGADAKGAILKITAVAGAQAIETPVPLD